MKDKYSVIVFAQGSKVPSTRFRVGYLEDNLADRGVLISVANAHESAYPPSPVLKRFSWLLKELMVRVLQVFKSRKFDAVVLQREMISTLPTLECLTKRPRILDVDDAIWMHRNGWAANTIAKHVDHIVCGNAYLAAYFNRFETPVTIIPTPVDTKRFVPVHKVKPLKVIGWSGTSGGFPFLYAIQDALADVLKEHPEWTLRIVSDRTPTFEKIPSGRIEFVQWSIENEVDSIATMDIGIMPLDDTDWSRGKCSYKMLLYMACAVPVVVSNCGMNAEVLEHEFIGFGANSSVEWYGYLTELINNPQDRARAGLKGRQVVLEHYSIDQALEKWERVIKSVLP